RQGHFHPCQVYRLRPRAYPDREEIIPEGLGAEESGSSKKRECSDFDALARPRIGRRCRVVKGRMRGPPRAASLLRLVGLENPRLVWPHPREPVPAMRRIVGDRISLADTAGVAALGYHQAFGRDALRIGDRQWPTLDRMMDRPPHLDDGEAAPKQLLCLVR